MTAARTALALAAVSVFAAACWLAEQVDECTAALQHHSHPGPPVSHPHRRGLGRRRR